MPNINFDVADTVIFENIKGVKTYTYRDIGTKNFKLNYTNNDTFNVNTINTSLYDVDTIKNAINNIFKFIPGQEILDPEFGNSLYNYLYTPIAPEMATTIKYEVISLLNKYEPRVIINEIKLETSADQLLIKIILYYSILNLPRHIFYIDFILIKNFVF